MSDNSEKPAKDSGSWKRTLIVWVVLMAGAFTFQTAAARRMYIPSASMMPALEKGDQLIVSKYPYGWSYASSPIHGSEVIPGRLFGKLPERGDIVTVARRSDGEDLIKRVIGLPGDTIEVQGGRVILNGAPVPRVAHGAAMMPVGINLPCDGMLRELRVVEKGRAYCRLPLFRETLPNGASYDTIDLGDTYIGPGGRYLSPGDNYGPVSVPAGHLFLMGDNRDQSADSRFSLDDGGLGGPVPFETISGRAEIITHSFDGSGTYNDPGSWILALRPERAWTSLRPARAAR
jgi:signal peptidase I